MSNLLRGIYFLRFAVILWVFPWLMVVLDWKTPAAAITRGIMTPESGPQATSAAFLIFSCGVIVLLITRLIAINGEDRFSCEFRDDGWLRSLLGQHTLPVWLFLAAHLPGFCTLFYLAWNMERESVITRWPGITYLVIGVLLGYLFWLFVGLLYLWSFDENELGNRGPVGLILPHALIPLKASWYSSIQSEPPPLIANWLQPFFRRIASWGGAGFAAAGSHSLYEGHRFAAVSIVGLLLLYLYLFPFTAPVSWQRADLVCNSVALIAIAFATIGIGWGRWPVTTAARAVKILATVVLLGFFFMVVWFWAHDIHATRGFSVLGSVLILVIGLSWMLSTVAFAFDGTRFPVLSGSLLMILLVKGWSIYSAEHYFTVVKHSQQLPIAPIPREIVEQWLARNQQPAGEYYAPLVVVTAEGGGIHSAAWTANVLMELEDQFREVDATKPFHSNILLASGVSGGSVGLLPFLREFTAPAPFIDFESGGFAAVRKRVVRAAACSSLQAVAWGLTYYDILNFLSPLGIPVPSTGVTERGNDRSWALERAFNRNLNDPACFVDPESPLDVNKFPKMADAYKMTLNSSADLLRAGTMPAFTFNTTAVETGGRFLLGNYELPDLQNQDEALRNMERQTDLIPAESFLHVFGHEDSHVYLAGGIRRAYADLPLATAARLSATFPYVSSASRIPREISDWSYHFADGGYFDNDGTSSAVEFLYFALMDKHANAQTQGKSATGATGAQEIVYEKPFPRKLPILFIEIRNDWDLDSANVAESFQKQNHLNAPKGTTQWTLPTQKRELPSYWGPDHQLVAPLQGFWEAGHDSDTRRNRRELCMLERAYKDRILIHHVVFDYRNTQDTNQPLSWDLTPNQKKNIRCALDPNSDDCKSVKSEQAATNTSIRTIQQLARDAAKWFNEQPTEDFPNDVCTSTGLGPSR